MTDRHTVVPRTLCFVFFGDEVLLLKASNNKEWEGVYNPVGGHIEKGEGVIECANREIQEETGLTVKNTKLKGIVHVTNFYGKNVMMFVTSSNAPSKSVVSSDEGQLEWVNLNKLESLKMFEDVKPILKHVLEMPEGQIFVGTSEYDGKDKLLSLDIKLN